MCHQPTVGLLREREGTIIYLPMHICMQRRLHTSDDSAQVAVPLWRPQLYWICNTHPSPFPRPKPVIYMGEYGEFSGTCGAGNSHRYDFRDNTRTLHGTLNSVLDLSPRPMAHAVIPTISRPSRRDSSKSANDSYLFYLRRNRTHTVFIVPHGHIVVSGETLRTIESASEMWKRPYLSSS